MPLEVLLLLYLPVTVVSAAILSRSDEERSGVETTLFIAACLPQAFLLAIFLFYSLGRGIWCLLLHMAVGLILVTPMCIYAWMSTR